MHKFLFCLLETAWSFNRLETSIVFYLFALILFPFQSNNFNMTINFCKGEVSS